MRAAEHIDGKGADGAWLLLAVCVASMGFAVASLGARGDEPGVYLPVIASSVDAWPLLNVTNVAYGISPVWTWSAGLAGQFLPPLLAGRALSLLAWAIALCLYCRRRDSMIGLDVLVLFFNPFCFLFAMRCHPYWLGVMLLLAACHFLIESKRQSLAWLFAAVSTQNFLMFSALSTALGARETHAKAVRSLTILAIVVGSAIVSNWWLYGGRYPASFMHSSYYQPYLDFDGFTAGYLPLFAGLCGWFGLLFKRKSGIAEPSRLLRIALGAASVALFKNVPAGPVFNAFGAFGPYSAMLAKLLVTSGVFWFFRHGIGFAAIAMAAALALSTLPFFYERYVWFAMIPMYMVRAMRDPAFRPIALNSLQRRIASSTIVAASIFLSFRGSL